MAFNRWMHPSNPYKTRPNFKQLALDHPEFRKFVTQDISGKIHLDFKNPLALACLTRTLLKADFGLDVELPEKSLIPTVPSRLNYLLWISDLLKVLPGLTAHETVHGIDIGSGASCVYSLLAAKKFGWMMRATEKDGDNFRVATGNVKRNHLNNSITVVNVSDEEIFSERVLGGSPNSCNSGGGGGDGAGGGGGDGAGGGGGDRGEWPVFHFSMCNPPFYSSDMVIEEEVGKECEIKTSGGEVKFVSNLANQSRQFRDRVRIFSTLLGHKSSLGGVKHYLKHDLGVTSLTHTEFCQGRTMRWGVAWTFQPGIQLNQVIGTKAKKEKVKPFNWSLKSSSSSAGCGGEGNAVKLFQQIKQWLQQIKVDIVVRREGKHFCSARLSSGERLWQNQRKQRRDKRKEKPNGENCAVPQPEVPSTCCSSRVMTLGKFSESREDQSVENSSENNHDNLAESLLLDEMLTSGDICRSLNSRVVDSTSGGAHSGQEERAVEQLENGGEKIGHAANGGNSEQPAELECDLFVRLSGPVLSVDLAWVGGKAGRDGTHQLLQYLKNKHGLQGR